MIVLENMNGECKLSYRDGYCFISSQTYKQDFQIEFPDYNARQVKGGIPTLALEEANCLFSPNLGSWCLVRFEIAKESMVELDRKIAHRGQSPHFDICSCNNSQYDSSSIQDTKKLIENDFTIQLNLDLRKISNFLKKHFSIENTYLLQNLSKRNRNFTFRYHLGVS